MLSFLCRHDFYWSERHRSDRCRRCGAVRPGEGPGHATTGGLAALLAADEHDLDTRFVASSQRPVDTILEDWEGPDAVPTFPPLKAAPAPAPKPKPKPVPVTKNGGASLVDRIEHLASGGELSRAETIETLLALIEDGQSSDPVVFGPTAATWYARLHGARQIPS